MNYKIVSDSSSNLLVWDVVDFASVPLKVLSSEKEYIDDEKLDVSQMVEDLKTVKGSVKTSCPNTQEWMDAFCGGDRIFAITITSRLSGSYNAASLAANCYMEEHPDCKIYVIDSYTTGGEMQLLIEKLAELIKSGKSFDEIKNEIEAYKNTTHLIFSLKSLTNLARNGRVSPAVAAIAGVLGIRVIGSAVEGNLSPTNKVRGEKKALSTIFANMKANGYNGGKVRINHCFNEEGADNLKNIITAAFPDADVSVIPCGALCSFYAEDSGMIVGYEGGKKEMA